MKKLFTALASAVFLLVSASAFAGQPTPLTMQIDRTQDPSPVCLYRLTSGTCILIGTISSSGVWSPTAASLHVANVDALKAFQNYDVSVRRDGFATPSDGGDATYVHSSAACTAPDDGAQVSDKDGTGCWKTDLSKPISAQVWGVKANGVDSDSDAWDKVVAAMGAPQGDVSPYASPAGIVLMPTNTGTCSKLTRTLLILKSGITIKGGGPHVSCFDPQFATGSGVQFGDSTHYVVDVGIEGVGFRSDLVHRTSGNSLAVWNTYYFSASNIACFDFFYGCVGIDQNIGGNDYNFDRVYTSGTNGVTVGAGVYGFTIGANTPAGTSVSPNGGPVEVRVTRSELGGLGYGGTAGAAFNVVAVGGLYTHLVNTDFIYQSVWMHPGTGQLVSGWTGVGDNWDTQTANAILLDTTGGGKITDITTRAEWVATCGVTSSGYQAYACVQIQGPTDTVENVDMEFLPLIAAGGHGVVANTGRDISFRGHIAGNGLQNLGAFNAIVLNPPSGVAMKDITIDARLGGSSGADATLPPDAQNCGLVVLGGGGTVTNLTGKGNWSGNRGSVSGICDNDAAADQLTHDFTNVSPTSVPVLSGAGTSPSLSAGATDTRGTVTEGTSAAGFTLTFGRPTGNPRDCMISSPTGTAPTNYSVSTTALTLVNASGSGAKFTYVCR